MDRPTIVLDVDTDKDEGADEAAYEPGWYSILKETADALPVVAEVERPA